MWNQTKYIDCFTTFRWIVKREEWIMKMKKQFCTYCMDYRECEFQEKNKKEKIDNIEIEYLEKCYICKTCGEKIYGDLLDYNTIAANKRKNRSYTSIRDSRNIK